VSNERKYIKPLTNNHWMARIQKSVLGIDCEQTYNGYCPFFWVTWLCVLMFPFSFLFKGGRAVGLYLWTEFEKKVDKYFPAKAPYVHEDRVEVVREPFKPSSRNLVDLKRFFVRMKELGESEIDWVYFGCAHLFCGSGFDMKQWVEDNPDWEETLLPIAKLEVAKLKERKEAQAKAVETKRLRKLALINKVSKVGQLIVKPILVAIALAVVALLYWIGSLIVMYWNWDEIWNTGVIFTLTTALFVSVIFAAYWSTEFLKKNKTAKRVAYAVFGSLLSVFGGFGAIVVRIFTSVFGAIGAGFSFLAQTVAMSYKAECPIIIWGDTTEKIQKNAKKDLDKK